MKQHSIPKRADVDKRFTWATEDLFASDELWKAELEDCKALKERALSYKGRLAQSADTLYEYLRFNDKASIRIERLANYAMRKADEDTGNNFYQGMRGKLMAFLVELESAVAFAVPEIIAMSDETIAEFYADKPELKLYERYITKLRKRRAHILSDAEEKLLAAAGEVADAPETIGSTFRNADLKFPNVKDDKGNTYTLTQGSFIPLMENSDVNVRRAAFETLYNTFASYKNTTAAILNAQVKQLMFYANARKYASTMEASLDRTEVPTSVYHNLIKAVHENMDKMHKYVRLRKKLMGVDELHMYDLYTPVVGDSDEEITFEQAKQNVLEGLAPLGEKYLSVLREGFENRWIDVYENEGKRSGAYSAGGSPHPYVLLNHKNTLDSQFTLAHEMGHALHSYFSLKTQPTVYADYVIFVAEVASTCNEVLLMRHLLSKTTDKHEKAALINHFLEQFRTTLYRQTMFAEFEMLINEMAEKGESLTADLLCDTYYELNRKYYGDDIVVDKEISYEWERIPHFFYNFYVFQYATGFSAAVAIANRILAEGQSAVDDYLKFLSSGGSSDPISLLKIAGVDMTTAKPVEDALKIFGELIDELDEIMSE